MKTNKTSCPLDQAPIVFAVWLEKHADMPDAFENGNNLWTYCPPGENRYQITLEELYKMWQDDDYES